MIKIAEVLPPDLAGTPLWRLMEQAGVQYAVGTFFGPNGLMYDERHPWDYVPLLRLKEQYERSGFELAVIEARPPLNLAKRGLPGGDDEIAEVVALIENMGRLGIKTWCYEWMTDFNWQRTSTAIRLRGGSLGLAPPRRHHAAPSLEPALVRALKPGRAALPPAGIWDNHVEAAMAGAVAPAQLSARTVLGYYVTQLITGLGGLGPGIYAKMLELLLEATPKARRRFARARASKLRSGSCYI